MSDTYALMELNGKIDKSTSTFTFTFDGTINNPIIIYENGCPQLYLEYPTSNIQLSEISKVKVNIQFGTKHGHWHILDECANEGVYCSCCNKKVYKLHYANQKLKSKYCPNCGALMDE